MSVMTTSETPVSTVTEPEVFRRTRNRFNQWLQTEFDRHYHTMRDGGYRSFLKKNHPTELERYDEACEALRREEFARFAELQTLGLYLHLQVQQKEAQFRRRRNRLLLGMTITGVMTSVLLYANFYPEQLQLISHELATLPGRIPIPCLSTWASPVMTPKAFLSELAEPAPDLNAPTPETPIPLIPVGLPVHVDFLSQWHSFQAAPHSVVSFFPSESLRRQSVRPLYSVHRLPD